jgi:PST family polysaccharide transporter
MVISFGTSVITARLLAPELFGLLTLVFVIIGAASIFANAGTRAGIVHFADPIEDVVSTAMVHTVVAGFGASFLVAGLAWPLAAFYDEPRLVALTLALAPLLFIQALSIVPEALLQRRLNLKLRRGLVDPLAVALYGVVVVLLALAGAGEWSLVAGQYANFLTLTIGSWILARPRFSDGRVTRATYRRVGRYGRSLLLANCIEVVEAQGVPVTLGRNLGPTAVGLYGAGWRLAVLPVTGITHVAGQVIFPVLSRLQDDAERFKSRFLESLRLLSLLTVPVCVSAIALGEQLVVILFGERWRAGGQALQILAIWSLGLAMADVGREAFKASGRSRLVARNAAVETTTLLGSLAALWASGHVTLLTVAGARAVAGTAALLSAAAALRPTTGASFGELWRAVRPSVLAGAAQCAALFAMSLLLVPGFEGWRSVGETDLGPLVPLVVLTLLATAGAAVYGFTLQVVQRGAVRELIDSLRQIARPAR